MSGARDEQGRRAGWIVLIPVAVIVALVSWFIYVNAGRS